MRIILTGDRFWPRHNLIDDVLRRLARVYHVDFENTFPVTT
jgi:hypothetical protein